jgi:RNA polymerase sigma-70 factor (ECF subfamily)
LVEASVQLAAYAKQRPIAFYPWLRNIAWQKLIAEYRRHVLAGNRSVRREDRIDIQLPDQSEALLAERFSVSQTSPSGAMIRQEMQRRLHSAMGRLAHVDREVLILRYLEQMSMREIADTLGIREDAARQRHARAILRLQRHVSDKDGER